MYLVISKWSVLPGHEDMAGESTRTMRQRLRERPEVEFLHSMRTESGDALVAVGYRNEEEYRKLIHDSNGPFAQASKELGMENHVQWQWSEHGEAVQD